MPTAYNFVNATSLVITLQVFQLTQGLHRIQVFNPAPGGGTSNVLELTVAPPTNQPPIVSAGSNQTITLPASASLNGTVTDDGLPTGSTLIRTWSKVSGPGTVTFGNVNAQSTTANFSTTGSYVLRLTATDGALTTHADVTIVAGSNQTSTLSGEIPPSFFGMTLINTAPWPTVPVGALGKGTFVSWIYIETSRGVYDWSNLDRWVAFAESHGTRMFWANAAVPDWAAADQRTCFESYGYVRCTSMITDIADWDNFITAMVTRYKGKLDYELWNEPEQPGSWTWLC